MLLCLRRRQVAVQGGALQAGLFGDFADACSLVLERDSMLDLGWIDHGRV